MALNVEDPTLPVDACVIALDETRDWTILGDDQPYIERILGVYLYDRGCYTYCCSATPSYFLDYLRTRVDLTASGEALSEERKQEIYDRYEGCEVIMDDPSGYFDVSTINRLANEAQAEGSMFHQYGLLVPAEEDMTREEVMEDIREDVQGNHYI